MLRPGIVLCSLCVATLATAQPRPAGPQLLGAALDEPCDKIVAAWQQAGLTRSPQAGPSVNEYLPGKPLPAPLTKATALRLQCTTGKPSYAQLAEVRFPVAASEVKSALDAAYGPAKGGSWKLPGDWALTLSQQGSGARVAYVRTKTVAAAPAAPAAGKTGAKPEQRRLPRHTRRPARPQPRLPAPCPPARS